jgi:putative addiction module component (TIGR02574 family)
VQPLDLKLSDLTLAERIQLAEDLQDSVAADTGDLPLTFAQKAELELRLADLERDSGAGDSWDLVRAGPCLPIRRSMWHLEANTSTS